MVLQGELNGKQLAININSLKTNSTISTYHRGEPEHLKLTAVFLKLDGRMCTAVKLYTKSIQIAIYCSRKHQNYAKIGVIHFRRPYKIPDFRPCLCASTFGYPHTLECGRPHFILKN